MARRRRGGKPIELFPFLAILACVIGVLTLMIAGLSMGALDIDTSGTEFALLKRATAADQAEIERREQQARSGRIRNARVRHARAELARREAASEEMDKLEAERDALLAKRNRLQVERDTLKAAVRLLQDRVVKLQTEIAKLGGERGRASPIEVRGPRPRPGQRKLRPWFIECRKESIVLDADLSVRSRTVLPLNRLSQSSSYSRLLSEAKRAAGGIVILMVREGSVAACNQVQSDCERIRVPCGMLPAPGSGTIDYSALRPGR